MTCIICIISALHAPEVHVLQVHSITCIIKGIVLYELNYICMVVHYMHQKCILLFYFMCYKRILFITCINCIIGIVCTITWIIYYHVFVLYAICIMCIVCTVSALLWLKLLRVSEYEHTCKRINMHIRWLEEIILHICRSCVHFNVLTIQYAFCMAEQHIN